MHSQLPVTLGHYCLLKIVSEAYRGVMPAPIQPNAGKWIGLCLTVQMNNDPKHTAKATQEFSREKENSLSATGEYKPLIAPALCLLKTNINI